MTNRSNVRKTNDGQNRAGQFAPSWLPRQARRRIDRELHKLVRSDVCSVCGKPFKHNTRTASGLDAHGNVALAGECCSARLAEIFTLGLYSTRSYDFLLPRADAPVGKPGTAEQIARAIAACQKAIAETDKQLDGIERRGGGTRVPNVSMLDRPWKRDDRDWFEHNPERSHRVRMPFPGEVDGPVEDPPAGHVLIVLLRQVEPGTRMKATFYLHAKLLPVPDNEAVAHALFEVATQREAVPPDRQALITLIQKYMAEPRRHA